MQWFWLSFADPGLPKGEQFLGAVILPIDETIAAMVEYFDHSDRIDLLRERGQEDDIPVYVAVSYAAFLGLNPGGEVLAVEIPEDKINRIPDEMRGRLLTREETETL